MARPIGLVVITPAEVSAYVDGELSPEERHDVAACAAADERATHLVEAWQWQLGLLHAAFGRIVEEPVPDRLRHAAGLEKPSRQSASDAGRASCSRGARPGEQPYDQPDHRQ